MVGRRSVASTVTNGGHNGESHDNVPPPSTLAAQLVREHAPETRRAVSNPSAAFSQLLNEILHNDSTPETDSQVNYKAISVVVQFGLDILSVDDDPFAQEAGLLSQARDSISVIEITIKRQPELLFFTQNDGQSAPMAIWLFARLLKAAIHPKYRDLQLQVSSFLATMAEILSRSLDYWQYAKAIHRLYQDAVDDINDRLEEQPRLSAKAASSLNISLPAARSVNRLCQGSGVAMTISSDAQVTVSNLRDVVDVGLMLVDACGTFCREAPDQAGRGLLKWTKEAASLLKRSIEHNRDILGSDYDACSARYLNISDDLGQMYDLKGFGTRPSLANSRGPESHGAEYIPATSIALDELLKELAAMTTNGASQPRIPKRTYTGLEESERERLWSVLIMIPRSPAISTGSLKHYGALLESLLDHPELKSSARCRVLAAQAVHSYAQNSRTDDYLDLSTSSLGRWCVKSLTHASRELRASAARALVAFLREDLPVDIRDNNRREALATFRQLSTRSETSQHETLVHTWGQVVLTCGDRERNLALLQLVDYLGHGNPLISGLAAYEMERIAEALNVDPEKLLRPYWKSIAVAAVRDLMSVPQKTRLLADFLRRTVDQFLLSTQADTIPFLVLTKKKDILRRIAAARSAAIVGGRATGNGAGKNGAKTTGAAASIQNIIVQPRSNLAGVLALLLCQRSEDLDPEEYITAVLSDCVPEWTEQEISSLIRLEPFLVVAEMLKTTGDEEDPGRKPALYKAIQDLAVIIERKSTSSRSRPAKLLGNFFETHVLGIMTQFSNTIERNDEFAIQQEKARCLKGIEEMVNLARTHIDIAIPQIRACLQSAIDQGGLIDPAISAWLALMSSLDGDDVVHLLGHLFSIVVQHWFSISPDIQQKTYDTVAYLLKTHSDAIRDEVIMIPSLADIPLMSKFEAELSRLKSGETPQRFLQSFVGRLQDENASIVLQAGRELHIWLEQNQSFVHDGAVSEPPMPIVVTATRSLLDACVKYNNSNPAISDVCAKCLGVVGCLDPNRIESNVIEPHMLMLSNFEQSREVCTWVAALFTDVLVPAFKSATNARAQGFLAWVMQELLKFVKFENIDAARLRSSQTSTSNEVWLKIPENTRNILTPFMSSSYVLSSNMNVQPANYPIFALSVKHGEWIRKWVYDMLWRGKGDNPRQLFKTLARVILAHDISIAKFLLPYVALNIVLGGDVREVQQVGQEMLVVLSTESTEPAEQEVLRQCSEDIFSILDYMSRWAQEKKRTLTAVRIQLQRAGHSPDEFEELTTLGQIESVENLTSSIPANIIAQRAIECGSYTRALFHWENFIREQKEQRNLDASDRDAMYTRLQTIYSEIDEPDGLDGIASQMNILTPEQQAWQHLHAGRWTAAQSWYEIELMNKLQDRSVQDGLLTCLQQSGQTNQVIRVSEDLTRSADQSWKPHLLAYAAEAAWTTGRLRDFADDIEKASAETSATGFPLLLGSVLLKIEAGDLEEASRRTDVLRTSITRHISSANAGSFSACHDQLLQFHVLHEVEELSVLRKSSSSSQIDTKQLSSVLDKRLAVLGTSMRDKQFVLGIRRAVLKATKAPVDHEIGKSWLTTARLARKADIDNSAHFAVICASKCGDDSSKIEQARLMWKNGQHRQAIHSLQGAIDSNVFASYDRRPENTSASENPLKQNMLAARAHLLLAKWLDASGQTQTMDVTAKYQYAARNYAKWEKGHYYLGKHYNKLLEAEKNLPASKQNESFISGEITKLVIENYLRSIPFGSKYWYQTIPKLITLWLDLGMDCLSRPRDLSQEMFDKRNKFLNHTHSQLRKYYDRVPRYVFYTALPQLISRISHPNAKVAEVLSHIISGVVSWHPQQGLWALLPVAKATAQDRANRGREIISKLRDTKSKSKSDAGGLELRTTIMQGQKLQDGLLNACEVHLEGRSSSASLSRDLGFNHKLAPSALVVPFQHTLTPNIPTVQDAGYIRSFKAFATERITIAAFQDDVLVLNSLQRPRKLTLRGSDGKSYSILCKPKDDLRKDQRLMEFNTMINRALKRDPESSKRRLYIKTYGVTPLSEESGTIEWVEGIKPLRDILLKLYNRKGISPNYTELRALLNDASSHPDNYSIFTRKILPSFPPVLHEWFTELFPSPSSWFASRLRYTRTAAVMSMVGHVLGLGDRHGENILLEESHGGVFHVDFNCLFDKGLTFEKPELVPFRLTHNMVDAMGPVLGVEGPFRKSAELTLLLLRENQDTLMNVLETFLHDPTTDFVGKRRRGGTSGVPETPREVLDSVSGKLKGFLRGESVPLSVEGMVQALIRQARDEGNLCRMYIGWCAFL